MGTNIRYPNKISNIILKMNNDYLTGIKKQFAYYKQLGDKTFEQLAEADFFWQYNEESNSIALRRLYDGRRRI